MYFGTPSTPAKKDSTPAGDAPAADQGMIGKILTMIGVPPMIISILAMLGLKWE